MPGWTEKTHKAYADRIRIALDTAGETINTILEKSRIIDAQIKSIIGKETILDKNQISGILSGSKGMNWRHLQLLHFTLDFIEGKPLEDIIASFSQSHRSSTHWIKLSVTDVHAGRLSEQFRLLSGNYSCFYRSREKEREYGRYIERVRYTISDIDLDEGHLMGQYITDRSSKVRKSRSFAMIMSNKSRFVFSVVHFPESGEKTILYSLVKSFETIGDYPILYGITVREGRNEGTIIAFKTIWLPEKVVGDLKDQYIFQYDELEDKCLTFLEHVFQHSQHDADHFYLEFEAKSVLEGRIDGYVRDCGDQPLIRLQRSQELNPDGVR